MNTETTKIFENNSNKNLLIIIVIVVALIIIGLSINSYKEKKSSPTTISQNLETVGQDFYENYYYSDMDDEQKTLLAEFKDQGIVINITNLETITSLNENLKNNLIKKECDFDETKIVIYPEEPYGKKDYNLKIELSCKK